MIFGYCLAVAMVGLVECLLRGEIVDDMRERCSGKNKEGRGEGIGNVVGGFFGGMGGCGMIGECVINT
ncbi:SulP family inorganic anion transporter, partial [Bacillus altitudinis]|uniref:SulP family inorganic anion transporter n=1 Tax=Bacillus altitudinis TaxID=293387 RepID=UPI001EED06D2